MPADRPQPLPTHLHELRGALLGPLLLFGLLLAATFAGSDAILRAMLKAHGLTGSVSLYAPAEFLRVRLGLAALAGCLGALPLALLQTYRCLLYPSDAADNMQCVDLGGFRDT